MIDRIELQKKVSIFQIYYNDDTLSLVHPDFIPYNNTGKLTPFFENSVILDIASKSLDCEYVGVVSPKFYDKVPHWLNIHEIIKRIESEPSDVYTFYPQPQTDKHKSILVQAENWHKGFTQIIEKLFDILGFVLNKGQNRAHIYSNYWLMKPEVLNQYVTTMLKPCIEVMSDPNEKELQAMLWQDSHYRPHPGFKKEMEMKLGVQYYPMHTFVLERLVSLWLDNNEQIKIGHLWK